MQSAADHYSGMESSAKFLGYYELGPPDEDGTFCWWFGSICNGIQGFL